MRRTQTGAYTLTQDIHDVYLAAIATADLDNDGALDVIGCDFGSDVLRHWEKTANGWATIPLTGSINNPLHDAPHRKQPAHRSGRHPSD